MTKEGISPIRPTDKALKPEQLAEEKAKKLPNQVLESFNELIAENYSEGYARVLQKDVVKRMIAKGLRRGDIFDKGWLDVEDIYRKAGWGVTYDQPIYYGGEDFDAYFEFSRRKRSGQGYF